MVYLSDVPPVSGGTAIWPTSPQKLWECLDTEHNCGFNPNGKYSPMFEEILASVQPVEFVGGAGDVMFRAWRWCRWPPASPRRAPAAGLVGGRG